jgi:hypothetical protein
MTDKHKVDVGGTVVYSTKPVGAGHTYLYLEPWYDDKNVCGDTSCIWHIELDKQQDRPVTIKKDSDMITIDVSDWPGALFYVNNTGDWAFNAWTNY